MRIEKNEIAGKLAKLKSVIPSEPTIESMKGVLVKNGTLTANNLETALRTPIECDTQECFILPQRAIDMIESLPEGIVEITSDASNTISIKMDGIKNKFMSFPPDTFPDIADVDGGQSVGIESDGLQEAIKSIMYAVAITAQRPQVTGLYFEGDGTDLNLVACDGYRMAWAKLPYTTEFKMIVPRAAIQTLLSMGISGTVSIQFNRRAAIFTLDDYTFYARLLEGEYLDFRKMFPQQPNSVVIDRRALLESVNRSVICTEDKGRPQVILEITGDNMKISTQSAFGEYTEDLRLDTSIDESIRIGFNAKYLLDCLKSYRCTGIECSFGSSQTPMVADDGDVKSLVLPVRLSA